MKFFKILRRGALATLAFALMTASQSWAGIVSELPTIRVNGKVMYYYDTQSGDNIYTVAEKLGVSVEEIRAYNPSVSDGVKPRMRLFFPTDIATTTKGDSAGPLTHVVAKGESIYGIARQHNLTMDQLLTLNPAAADGIKAGMRLKLRDDDSVAAAPEVSAPV
ncbi:MAG: LysM peptidoglycan-binding domain-containing protein, partial [Muribaculaceae bacterium]|nr:LysM peptidoglycan-binding domain-containing protein [Muribaculaceae bacterium]